jgi:hypothetical protein
MNFETAKNRGEMQMENDKFAKRAFSRRTFLAGLSSAGVAGCRMFFQDRGARYSVALLGDTHYDTEPESVYHEHYDRSNRFAAIQLEEFKRNGEMWRSRNRLLVAASGRLSRRCGAAFMVQTGDSNKLRGAQLADFRKTLDLFRPGLKECFCSHAAGHCMLDVSDMGVTVKFYPGSSEIPSQVFSMT